MTTSSGDAGRDKPWILTDAALKRLIRQDRRRSWGTALALAAVFVVASAGLVTLAFTANRASFDVPVPPLLILAAFGLVASVAVPSAVLALHRVRRQRWERRQRECQELAAIAQTIDDPALGDLISFNFRLMDRFTAVAIEQARVSFLACTAAATATLLVLLFGAATAMTVDDNAGQIVVGALTGVGAALSSFISVAYLRTFKMTSQQMSYYYGQPLVHCYLLHAEWLGKRFEQDADAGQRWQIRQELIQASLEASRNAQVHLLDLQLGAQGIAASAAARAGLDRARSVVSAVELNGHGRS